MTSLDIKAVLQYNGTQHLGLGVTRWLEQKCCAAELAGEGPAADTSEGGPLHQAGRAEPGWLSLPQVHFIMLRGNQSLSFRLQPQLPNEFSWLAWEVVALDLCYSSPAATLEIVVCFASSLSSDVLKSHCMRLPFSLPFYCRGRQRLELDIVVERLCPAYHYVCRAYVKGNRRSAEIQASCRTSRRPRRC